MVDDWAIRVSSTAVGSDGNASSALDETFDLLSAERRRHVLYCLRERGDPISLFDLADAVADEETASPADPESHRERVAISLGQVHLPKLDDAGVVDYRSSDRRVEYVGDALVESFLAPAAELER